MTPASTTGRASRVEREGRSPSSSHAKNPTMMTWRLPRTVARPAPTASMAWCQNIRSPVKKMPAIAASRMVSRGSGPCRRHSPNATRTSNGNPNTAR